MAISTERLMLIC